jgi:pimeloyl-ACP methyl ester carboxylesterase
MVHGGLSHSSEWIHILKSLSGNFSLYVVDRPGHGLSDPIDYRVVDYRNNAVEFLESFMDAIGLKRARFMGNSMGGYFSLCFAFDKPERVEKLLLIGAPAGINLWVPPILRVLGTRGINRLLMKTIARPSISAMKNIHKQILVFDIDIVSEDYLEHCYYNQLLPGSQTAFRSLLEKVLTIRGWRKQLYLGDQLNKLQVPVGFIWGNRDAFESPATGIQKARAIKNHSFEVVENAGHCPWIDQPEQCTFLITKMLNN